jgi:hypothetical protein
MSSHSRAEMCGWFGAVEEPPRQRESHLLYNWLTRSLVVVGGGGILM